MRGKIRIQTKPALGCFKDSREPVLLYIVVIKRKGEKKEKKKKERKQL